MAATNKLIVLPPSHYCERARWALDAMRIPYEEERWAVGLHIRRAKRIAPSTSLPILVTGDGAVIQGSARIVDWTQMRGGDAAVEKRLEDRMGMLTRKFVYAVTLGNPKSGMAAVLFDGVRGSQAVIGRLMWPVTRKIIAKAMQADPAGVPGIVQEVEAEFDWLEDRLGGKPFLVGDRFGRGDMTAASLMSPLISDSARPGTPKATLPSFALDILARWRARPALRWAQSLYGNHRRTAFAGPPVAQ